MKISTNTNVYCEFTRMDNEKYSVNEKALRGDAKLQTLRAGFAPPQTRFPGAQDGQNLISWRWSLGEDRCTQIRVILVTDPQTHKQTHLQTNPQTDRTDYNTLRHS